MEKGPIVVVTIMVVSFVVFAFSLGQITGLISRDILKSPESVQQKTECIQNCINQEFQEEDIICKESKSRKCEEQCRV